MSYKICVHPTAFEDMQKIGDYIAVNLCAPEASLKLLSKFNERIICLSDFPFSGDVLKTDYPLQFEYRRIVVENYIIFYTVDEKGATVKIMRVLYGSSNYFEFLKN